MHRRLNDIVSFGSSIVTKLRGQSAATFAANADLHDLVYYRLLCVSEAARSALVLDPDIEKRHVGIPWAAVRGLGNVLRHEYGEIDATIIWQTVSRGDVDSLIAVAQAELARLEA